LHSATASPRQQTPAINRAHSTAAPIEGSHRPAANMSLVNLAHVCSHMQNASKARLGLTSIPATKMHAKIALSLQREGFLSSVTLGGPTPPKPFLLQAQQTPEEMEKVAKTLAKKPWHAYPVEEETEGGLKSLTEEVLGKELVHDVKVPENAARRRLWLGLKYWQNEPVLKYMQLISKPTRRIWLTSEDLGKITRTRDSSYVKGLTRPGECMFITTDRGILEARECVERRMGGMALCRVWG
jgi:ribosomal protein S8